MQGRIMGFASTLGFATKEEATFTTLISDVMKTSEIEGEKLDHQQVRSSLARKLGLNVGGLVASKQQVEGVVEMVLDATRNHRKPLTRKRLFAWHAALFPTGYSGLHKIEVGRYRTGEMQVVSGAMGKEKVHYEAIPAERVNAEMKVFLDWFNHHSEMDPVLKAAVAHFWFIIIHPFDDGNGRMARALSDLLLARADGSEERYYSLSSRIMVERKRYYEVLKEVQHSSGDITNWLCWFLGCLKNALLASEHTWRTVLRKTKFWQVHEHTPLNARQRLVLNKFLDGFEGKLQSSKWAKMAKCSTDTALRDIKDLMDKAILEPVHEGGRSTHYGLVEF